MPLNWSTSNKSAVQGGIKIGVYGLDGSGKTTIIPTCPRPIIVDVEGKLLSIAQHNIVSVRVHTWQDAQDFLDWLKGSAEAKNYDTPCYDSFSTLAELSLAEEKRNNKDARRAYQEHRDKLAVMIRGLIALPDKNILFNCKAALTDQPDGTKLYSPSLPGTTPDTGIGYYLNELFRITISHFPGPSDTTLKVHWLQTQQDAFAQARDNSNTLSAQEKPDITYIINKIRTGFAPPPPLPN